jgi:hypothetical protein
MREAPACRWQRFQRRVTEISMLFLISLIIASADEANAWPDSQFPSESGFPE